MFMLQQGNGVNLYSFNKVSWRTQVMRIRVSTLKNGEVRLRVMTIRPNTLSVSWYEGVCQKVSVEEK